MVGPSFQGVNKHFVLFLKNEADRRGHAKFDSTKLEIKDYSVKIYDWNIYDQPVKNEIKTCENFQEFTTSRGNC